MQAPKDVSDADAVSRILAGEPLFFEQVMRRHNPMVYRAVRAILRDEAEADDAMQAAYLSAFEHLAAFKGASKLSTWLVRIAVNEALQRLRKRRPSTALDEATELPSALPSPEDANMTKEMLALLEHTIDELPETDRVVVMLKEIQELPIAEVAEILEINEEAVKQRLHRAKAKLQDRVLEKTRAGLFGFEAPRCNRVTEAVLRRIAAL